MFQKIKQYLTELNDYNEKPEGFRYAQMVFLLFFAGCVVGWIYEEFFYYFVEGKLLNSGFFYGPYLPVYGFGGLFILLTTKPFKKKHWTIVFFGSMFVTGVLEYITGWVMYQIWEARWWDYRGLFLNIDGFVCLRSVLTFAIGGIGIVYLMEPMIRKFCKETKDKVLLLVSGIPFIIMLIDVILTFLFREHVPMI